MIEFNQYYGRFQGFRGQIGGLPQWARTVVGIFAVPGLVLMGLSLLAFLVSLLALLLLTVPVYSLLRRLTAGTSGTGGPIDSPIGSAVSGMPFGITLGPPVDVPSGTKRVDSTVVE